MLKKLVCLVLIIMLFAVYSFAQTQLDWKVFTNTNYTYELAKEDGTIWLSALGGIVAFDPSDSSYTIYNSGDGLKGNYTTAITVDSLGNKWIGTHDYYLNKFDDTQWRQFDEFDGIGDAQINDITQYGDDIWVATQKGITQIDIANGTGMRLEYWKDKSVNDIFFDADGKIWIGTAYGIHTRADSTMWEQYLDSYTVRSITQDYLGNMWAATAENGLYRLDVGSEVWQSVSIGNYAYTRRVTAIDSTIWLAVAKSSVHGSSILRFTYDENSSLWAYEAYNNGLSHSNGVYDFIADDSGIIWAATWGSGIAQWDGEIWHEIPFNCIVGNRITGLDIDSITGELWLASRKPDSQESDYKLILGGGSRYIKENDEWIIYQGEESITGNKANDVVVDNYGGKWFSGWLQGISHLEDSGTVDMEDDQWTYLKFNNSGLYSEAIRQLYVDHANVIWVGEHAWHSDQGYNDGGLEALVWPDSIWVHFGRAEGIPGGGTEDRMDCLNMAEDNNYVMWGGTQGGVFALDYNGTVQDKVDDQVITFNTLDGLLSPMIWAIEPVGNIIWIGSEGGLNSLDHKGTIFDKTDDEVETHLQGITVFDVKSDPDSLLWIATNAGLKCYDPQHKLFESDWKTFTSSNSPLSSDFCNEVVFGQWERGHKEIYVGTELGCSKIIITTEIEPAITLSVPCPNPFIPSEGHNKIIFEDLTANTQIFLYNLAGELILETKDISWGNFCDKITEGYRWVWDGKNLDGNDVASGVYVYVINKGDSTVTGKIAIVR